MELDKRSDEKTEVTDLSVAKAQLPDTIEELSQFVFIGREKLTALKAAIRACNKADILSRKLGEMKDEEQLLAENVLLAEVRIGELRKEVPRVQGRKDILSDTDVNKFDKQAGITERTGYRLETLARHQDLVEEAIQEARNADRAVTRQDVLNKVAPPRERHKAHELAKALESQRQVQNRKKEGVLVYEDSKTEKENFKVFAHNFKDEVGYWLPKAIRLNKWNEKDLKRIVKELSPETRQDLAKQISDVTKILCRIGKALIDEER